MALCIEAGGRLNEQFLKLIGNFASVNGSTEAERCMTCHFQFWYT